jgi:hypothetical protein
MASYPQLLLKLWMIESDEQLIIRNLYKYSHLIGKQWWVAPLDAQALPFGANLIRFWISQRSSHIRQTSLPHRGLDYCYRTAWHLKVVQLIPSRMLMMSTSVQVSASSAIGPAPMLDSNAASQFTTVRCWLQIARHHPQVPRAMIIRRQPMEPIVLAIDFQRR